MTKADTTTCDACGTRYVFHHYKDRCPICCPDQSSEDDESDYYDQADWEDSDNDTNTTISFILQTPRPG